MQMTTLGKYKIMYAYLHLYTQFKHHLVIFDLVYDSFVLYILYLIRRCSQISGFYDSGANIRGIMTNNNNKKDRQGQISDDF